jgi:hypothetical protein
MKNIDLYYNSNPGQLFRSNQFDLLTMKVDGVKRNPGSVREELAINAKSIIEQYPDIHLALSGGWESQVALRAFIDAGHKPRVIIVKYPNNLNDNDVIPAMASCRQYGIEPVIIPGAFDKFLEGGLLPTVEKYQCYTMTSAFFARIAELANLDILIVDKMELKRDVNPNRAWNFVRGEDYSMWPSRFNQLNKNKVITNFFDYSAESMLSFLTLPSVATVVSNHASGKISLVSLKQKIYREAGYDMPIYHRTVATDRIPGIHAAATASIENAFHYKARFTYVDYNTLILALTNQGKKEWQYI